MPIIYCVLRVRDLDANPTNTLLRKSFRTCLTNLNDEAANEEFKPYLDYITEWFDNYGKEGDKYGMQTPREYALTPDMQDIMSSPWGFNCEQCKSLKVKCSQETPSCNTCLRKGFHCVYRRYGTRASQVSAETLNPVAISHSNSGISQLRNTLRLLTWGTDYSHREDETPDIVLSDTDALAEFHKNFVIFSPSEELAQIHPSPRSRSPLRPVYQS